MESDDEMESENERPKKLRKALITRTEWDKKLAGVPLSRDKLNQLVMNFLVVEGFQDVASKFSKEAAISPDISLELVGARMDIQESIHLGQIQEATEKINDFDPEILELNPLLSLSLESQKLIELIRTERAEEALAFAQNELAPRAATCAEFLPELEQIMMLVAFGAKRCAGLPCNFLLDQQRRKKIASHVNEAILRSQGQSEEPHLSLLLKRLFWEQQQLAKQSFSFPTIPNKLTAIAAGAFLPAPLPALDAQDDLGAPSNQDHSSSDEH